MSKAKQAAAAAPSGQSSSSSWSFAQGFLLGQLILALILFGFIKFFIFGEPPSADSRAATRAALRRQRTLSHSSSPARTSASDLRSRRRSNAAVIGRAASGANGLTTEKILEKTYYNVDGHQPESLDWFNVLIAQTVAQVRADALEGDAVLDSLTKALNRPQRPDFLDDIKITEISLGEEFPIFSNCRVIPVDENGAVVKNTGKRPSGIGESRLQARMDVDLSDVVTLGIETKLLLNYPKPFSAVLPVALAVSVVRFSGTLSVSFTPSQPPPSSTAPTDTSPGKPYPASQPSVPSHSPTTLTFTFLDDYRLDLSVHSLIGSRSRLQDVPKIAQLVEQRIHAWFDERCVEPRFQQIVLPSLWPRKRNVRGGGEDAVTDEESSERGDARKDTPEKKRRDASRDTARPESRDQRNRHAWPKPEELMTDEERLAAAGDEIREAEERERERAWERERRSRERQDADRDRDGMRRRPGPSGLRREASHRAN